jgi:hypothetical protein
VLSLLWGLSVVVYLGLAVYLALRSDNRWVGIGGGLVAAVCALMSLVMAWGLWGRKPWARLAQIVLAGLGLLDCPFTLSSIVILAYLFRPVAKIHFSGRRTLGELSPAETEVLSKDRADVAFALILLATVLLGAIALPSGAYLYTRWGRTPPELTAPAP